MGWKGVVREIDRANRRRIRENERELKYQHKMAQIDASKKEVSSFESYVKSLTSFHLKDINLFDWKKKLLEKKPEEPKKTNTRESKAKKELRSYSPSFLDKTFSRIEKKKNKLSKKIDLAKKEDETKYKKSKNDFVKKYDIWKKYNAISKGVLKGDLKFYLEAIEEIKPFDDKKLSCKEIEISMKNNKIAILNMKIPNEEDIIPQETKSFLKSGKVSIKPLPKTKYNELFQDYVCSLAIASAKILFSTLPLELVIVNASKEILNSQTGHNEESPILSVAISNKTLSKMNLKNVDASDCMKNFVHNMHFKKNSGFESVKLLDYSNFK